MYLRLIEPASFFPALYINRLILFCESPVILDALSAVFCDENLEHRQDNSKILFEAIL